MGRGRRILSAVWIVAHVAVLAFLVMDPQMTRKSPNCASAGMWVDWIGWDENALHDFCGVTTSSLVERKHVIAGTALANVAALVLWATTGRGQVLPAN